MFELTVDHEVELPGLTGWERAFQIVLETSSHHKAGIWGPRQVGVKGKGGQRSKQGGWGKLRFCPTDNGDCLHGFKGGRDTIRFSF
jgi:hypothetical protein